MKLSVIIPTYNEEKTIEESVRRVRVKLRHPHVLPQALLQVQLSSSGPLGVRYRVASQTDGETRFEPAAAGAANTEPSSSSRGDPPLAPRCARPCWRPWQNVRRCAVACRSTWTR